MTLGIGANGNSQGTAQLKRETPLRRGFVHLTHILPSFLNVCTTLYDVRTFLEENESEFTAIVANIRKIVAADDAVTLAA